MTENRKENIQKLIQQRVKDFLSLHERNHVQPRGMYLKIMNEVEKTLIETVFEYTDKSQIKTSEILGIHRNTLREKLNQHTITRKKKTKRLSRRRTKNEPQT